MACNQLETTQLRITFLEQKSNNIESQIYNTLKENIELKHKVELQKTNIPIEKAFTLIED